jgi:hypothetical protein
LDNLRLPISMNDSRALSHSPNSSPERSRSRLSPTSGHRRSSSIDQRLAGQVITPTTSPPPIEGTINGEIVLNGNLFRIGHNLNLALLHVRSPTHPVDIWIDAICINQADEQERNRQVSLMAFIYTRATKVVAWIGTKAYPPMTGLFRSMSLEWKAGQTQHFGAFLTGESMLRCSPKPDQGTFARITDSAYWRRMWIVQEMCLPRLLLFMYGSDIWTYEEFRKWDYLCSAQPEARLTQSTLVHSAAALKLLDTRDRRHTDMMRLENLIERFAKNDCSEVRDRIYGLLGCANDVRPFAERNGIADSLESHVNALSSGLESSYQRQQGMGWLRIDYSCTFYNLWARVVAFAYFQSMQLQYKSSSQVEGAEQAIPKNERRDSKLPEERQLNIVRVAGIIQNALSGKVEEEMTVIKELSVSDNTLQTVFLYHTDCIQVEQERPAVTALGFIAGTLVQLGPEYLSLMSSSAAAQDWTSCWTDHYQTEADLEILRFINEEYTARILEYEDVDLARVCNIWNRHVSAWPVDQGRQDGQKPTSSHPGTARNDKLEASGSNAIEGPRIFLGTGYVMGLASSAAAIGDVVVKFWNCNAAMLMRPTEPRSSATSFMLIGRADVAELVSGTKSASLEPQSATGAQAGLAHPDAVHVDLDLRTLQRITAYITT